MGLISSLREAVESRNRTGYYVNDREPTKRELAEMGSRAERGAREYDREQKNRAAALEQLGASVDLLTDEKVVTDALGLINTFAQSGFHIPKSLAPSRSSVTFQKLTKAGNLPKMVAKGQAVFDFSRSKCVVCNIRYLRDGSVCDAKVNEWSEDRKRHQVGTLHSIKRVDGVFVEDSVERERSESAKDDVEHWAIGAGV